MLFIELSFYFICLKLHTSMETPCLARVMFHKKSLSTLSNGATDFRFRYRILFKKRFIYVKILSYVKGLGGLVVWWWRLIVAVGLGFKKFFLLLISGAIWTCARSPRGTSNSWFFWCPAPRPVTYVCSCLWAGFINFIIALLRMITLEL